LVFFQADIPMDAVINEVFGIKLFSKFVSSLAKELLECTFRDDLVLFL